MVNRLFEFFTSQGIEKELSEFIANAIILFGILILCTASYRIAKITILKIIESFITKSKSKSDDLLIEHKVLNQIIIIIPAFLLYALSPSLLKGQLLFKKLAFCLMIFAALRSIDKLLGVLGDLYRKTEASKTRSIKGIIQISKIVVYAVGGILVLSILMDRSPALLLGGIGAASAVLLLIFQNTILGFVASIQLTENDMVRIGDWIEMPSHHADGNVVEISLHTVKVVNWDKTVTTIPTHTMITQSFKNWRNMVQTGGRRIKRSVFIDMNSIRFCTENMLKRYEKVQYIKEYLEKKTLEINEYNEKNKIDFSSLINGRRLTNLGTFRAYLNAYLKHNPNVHPDLMVLVRQLAPSEHGLPIELYFFTNTTKWVDYETIQADIFDHIFAIIPEFDLRIYQSLSSGDLV